MENLEIRLKCVELLIDAYKNKAQLVALDDIIYQADRLTDFIIGKHSFEENECLGSGILAQEINISDINRRKIDSALERLGKLVDSAINNRLREELFIIYNGLINNLAHRREYQSVG